MKWVPIAILFGALITAIPSVSASSCNETQFLIVEQRSCEVSSYEYEDCIWLSPAPGVFVCDGYYEWNDGSMGSTCHRFSVAGIIWTEYLVICPG